MAEYRKGAHTVLAIHLHVVWITKYRKAVLAGPVGERVRLVEEDNEFKVEEVGPQGRDGPPLP